MILRYHAPMRALFALCLALAAACSSDPCASSLPASYSLSAPGIRVTVQRCPYAVSVADEQGAPILQSSSTGQAGEGYGALGWTSGQISLTNIASPGYFKFAPALDPWRDRLIITSATQTGPDSLDAVLQASSDPAQVHLKLRLRPSTLRVEAHVEGAQPRAFGAAFASPPDEAFLGLGERFNRTDQRGLSLYSWPEEGGLSRGMREKAGPDNPWPNGETMTYYPVPFLLSSRGYALWLDSTWRNQWDLASDHPEAWRAWHIGPDLQYEVYVPIPADPRPWPYHLIDLFTSATGRPMVPPAWSFGPRRRINRGARQGGASEIQAMRDQGLAITALDDTTHFLPAGTDLDQEDALRAWVADARRLGYVSICYYNPYLAKGDQNPLRGDVQQGLQSGWFLRDRRGQPSESWLISGAPVSIYTVDFTSPQATAWYQRMFQRAIDLGYLGWMYDFGEYVQADVVTASGLSGEQLHNLFPVLYQKAAYDALEASPLKGQWYTFVRSGYTGASQYAPMAWSGDPDASFSDAEGVPAMVRAGINLGISGVAHWGSDIGGFKCLADGSAAADGELLARWIELGAMSSNMHDEDACAGGDGPKASIWTAPEARAAWRTYAALHTRLFPYFYGLAAEAHRSGAPVIRHLFLEHPQRRDLAGVDDAYYLGPALLVAPVVQRGARQRTVALPKGPYLDWRDQVVVQGGGPGTQVMLDAPLDKLPLLLRAGYLVPLLDPAIATLAEGGHPGIVGPAEVAGVYDVVGLLAAGQDAAFTLQEGGALRASLRGAFAAPTLPLAKSEADLATCAGCWLAQDLPGVRRVRISHAGGTLDAGGLHLESQTGRRARWDLYLLP